MLSECGLERLATFTHLYQVVLRLSLLCVGVFFFNISVLDFSSSYFRCFSCSVSFILSFSSKRTCVRSTCASTGMNEHLTIVI
ncbi:uncharacterized protein CANTADRAFT_217794 [Suhomyces tanzawaensis NRRL Y-17324]|uniref:Uncharacterized protein n=1 Tax=Suhomyces tanzawaensis NRRL Y-17324 TaxID=984487 RepID=A0A1E4SK28_9ASCO|nr:uncharacterized protein CANTADRAFT_217794 [Suhomyces tanzawaensis NRRL Y-17324]ODV79861.1 hypothetical protein CANTADRAFT_217794 [Suhomyces tanzawaensis NRRL Y-17324]